MHTEEKNTPPIEQWRLDEVAEYDLPLKEAPATILDIGANVGAWSLRCAAQYPSAIIYAYEPVLSTAIALEKNTRGKNVKVVNAAIRNFSGTASIHLGERDVVSSFYQLGRQRAQTEVVSCLEARLLPTGELVKIDTEGCELEIVEWLDLSNTRALVVEYHRNDWSDICKVVEAQGLERVDHIAKEPGYGILKFARPGVLKKNNPVAPVNPVSKTRNIFIAVAHHHSGLDTICQMSFQQLRNEPPCAYRVAAQSDSGLLRARNMLTARFLESDCTHLLFIDGDIGFTPNDVDRITSHDVDIAGGLYPLKTMTREIQWCGNGLLPTPSPGGEGRGEGGKSFSLPPVRPDGLQEVRYMGTGFLCIKRGVFEKLIAEDREAMEYKSEFPPYGTEWDFWRQGPRKTGDANVRYLTEDWLFCQRWLELGGKVFADTFVMLRHAGRAIWPLPLQDNNPFSTPDSELRTPNS